MTKRNISILLQTDIKQLGHSGTIVSVKAGYARNYLLPKKFAVLVTENIRKQAEKNFEIQQLKLKDREKKAKSLQVLLENIKVVVLKKKIGKENIIFGTVTEREIVQLLKDITGKEIDRKLINIPEIKTIGQYDLEIKILSNIIVNLELHVLPIYISV
uniref:50S ribosomal protein L9, chloroplastic n=1 Tax=Bangiopsis subsimplex TaxID=139980 RepID=A0A1C9CCW1_9RHOD|nr:ribosomal protein L9 [Bangiopsis subsimplex]AOM66219.1 ribosomal protein L9 [Bangiopsis subsimplex]ARO90420.1 50S ribosomal protein L9 [Bangiopsis subsimplex]